MNRQEIISFFQDALLKLKKENIALTEETSLADIGLDSLDIVEMQLMYEEKTGKELPDPNTPLKTISDLVNLAL